MSKKILVVEDDKRISLALSLRLRSAGFEVINAFDALAGVNAARQENPDLIVLDLGLPAGGGLKVAERVRALPKTASVPIIVVTALKDPEAREEALEQGVFAYFEKPFESAELLGAIHEALFASTP